MPDADLLFETEGRLLLNRRAPIYIVGGSLASFVAFLSLFEWVCLGLGGVSPAAITTLFTACTIACAGNLFIWRAMRKYQVQVSESSLILSGPGAFSQTVIQASEIEHSQTVSRTLYGVKAQLVEVKIEKRTEPVRLLVKDPEGLLAALKRASANQSSKAQQVLRVSV
jgi:hypothetical protein